MTKMQILGRSKQRDGCGNREEVAPMHDDYDWADDETLSYDETMKIIDALGPDVEITGPPKGAEIPPQYRQTASLTCAYAAQTSTYPQHSYARAAFDPTACPTG
jgi:hypothetical protein